MYCILLVWLSHDAITEISKRRLVHHSFHPLSSKINLKYFRYLKTFGSSLELCCEFEMPSLKVLLSLPFLLPSFPPSSSTSHVPDDLFGYRWTPSGQYFGDAGPPSDGWHPPGAPLALWGNCVDPLKAHLFPTYHTLQHVEKRTGRMQMVNKAKLKKREDSGGEEKRARLICAKSERSLQLKLVLLKIY